MNFVQKENYLLNDNEIDVLNDFKFQKFDLNVFELQTRHARVNESINFINFLKSTKHKKSQNHLKPKTGFLSGHYKESQSYFLMKHLEDYCQIFNIIFEKLGWDLSLSFYHLQQINKDFVFLFSLIKSKKNFLERRFAIKSHQDYIKVYDQQTCIKENGKESHKIFFAALMTDILSQMKENIISLLNNESDFSKAFKKYNDFYKGVNLSECFLKEWESNAI